MNKVFLFTCCFFCAVPAIAQDQQKQLPAIDSTITDYDLLFDELDNFLDALTLTKSFWYINTTITQGYFAGKNRLASSIISKTIFNPSVSYYHKSGMGVNASASLAGNAEGYNAYQYSLSGSYDLLKKKNVGSGVSYTHYFTKSDLPYYTSPVRNEVSGYFVYKNVAYKPSVSVSYAWGSTQDQITQQDPEIHKQRIQNNFRSVQDLNIIASLRKDFYWLQLFSSNDYARITPQVSVTSGSYFFAQENSAVYTIRRRDGSRAVYNAAGMSLNNKISFQPLSFSGQLKTEYSIGKFFLQPLVSFDYYIPASDKKFFASWMFNTGFIL